MVVAGTEAGEAAVLIVQPAREVKGLEAGRGISGDVAPRIVIEALGDVAEITGSDEISHAKDAEYGEC